ncbi:MAG: hypothetical protein A2W93_00635 [Bacteroidetes bacterium GWF2_43_63]|nr:MAG: hypothetical protein A2W94_12885 [Bacteroidetes bacterium GWE2_42_42]OFY53905.1 MAG: hypothetical protein A2W93_00635 [Bacteroidetes bacterium GWF2_43_63]HBG69870.1 hypothetical protein [Bacteroidales bacterium]HCB60933.1 hypothetical protein [Bacteroidales bacterium]HCY24489.1 hypothetical protein [Bacteroidales bacterium]
MMKKLLCIISFFILIYNNGNAQSATYRYFPDSSMWRVDYFVHNPFQNYYFWDSYFHYYINGDTVISAKQYKKIYRSYLYITHINVHPLYPSPQSQPPCYLGALRDDSVADKTFFVYDGTNTDSLLLDYNLQPGDTVKGIAGKYFTCPKTVNAVDSVLIDGNYHRRWILDSCINYGSFYCHPYIIEGIGSSSGLIDAICDYANDFTDRYLVCAKKGEEILFESGYISEFGCNLIVEGIEEPTQANLIHFSNPNVAEISIKSDFYLQNASLALFNSSGGKVLQMNQLFGKSFFVARNNLPAGIYFLQMNQNNRVVSAAKIIFVD